MVNPHLEIEDVIPLLKKKIGAKKKDGDLIMYYNDKPLVGNLSSCGLPEGAIIEAKVNPNIPLHQV